MVRSGVTFSISALAAASATCGGPFDRIVNEFNAPVTRYPHVLPNTPDPYLPPKM
jgi:hypothetical protein